MNLLESELSINWKEKREDLSFLFSAIWDFMCRTRNMDEIEWMLNTKV